MMKKITIKMVGLISSTDVDRSIAMNAGPNETAKRKKNAEFWPILELSTAEMSKVYSG